MCEARSITQPSWTHLCRWLRIDNAGDLHLDAEVGVKPRLVHQNLGLVCERRGASH